MDCPKCKHVTLSDNFLEDNFPVQCCQECKGTWIPASEYEAWQTRQSTHPVVSDLLSPKLDVDFVQSPFDMKAALCPECKRYLSRAKVNLKTAFYIERCLNCRGIWCDYGEWEMLKKMGMHSTIEQLFTNDWQTQVRSRRFSDRERQATIDKLGNELAARVFELAELLEKHPNGDFGVAYLMRRVAVNIQPKDFNKDL